jgi:type I restriction enzyme S subunit
MSLPRYPAYKDSGVAWLGEVPREWQIVPFYTIANEREESNKGMINDNLLSLSYGRVIRKDLLSNDGLLPDSFETYQIIRTGDIVFRLTDLQNDKRSLRTAIAKEDGIITSAYLAAYFFAANSDYYSYLLRAYDLNKVFYSMGGGLRQSMKFSDVKRLPVLLPPSQEQTLIAQFLDRETSKIDDLISEQEKLITLLDEKRQALISHAVTKGLNPDAPMKDSGVEWLGEVPEHWEVKQIRFFASVLRGKFTHRPRNDPAYYDGDFPFIQTGDITGADRYITAYKQTLNENGVAVSKQFPKGTLVMAIAANIGDVAVLDFPAYFPDSVVGLVPNNTSTLFFIYYLMLAMKKTMIKFATASAQMNLNVEQITSLVAACPTVTEQAAIVSYLDIKTIQIDTLNAEAQRGIELLKERRSALISAAVTGKIDVRGLVNTEAA